MHLGSDHANPPGPRARCALDNAVRSRQRGAAALGPSRTYGESVEIITMCGSASPSSANRAALNHAGDHLSATYDDVVIIDAALKGVPVFDPCLAANPSSRVRELSTALERADGVMITSPEYAGGLAGGTKTALGWMVGLASLYHRPVIVLSAGTPADPSQSNSSFVRSAGTDRLSSPRSESKRPGPRSTKPVGYSTPTWPERSNGGPSIS